MSNNEARMEMTRRAVEIAREFGYEASMPDGINSVGVMGDGRAYGPVVIVDGPFDKPYTEGKTRLPHDEGTLRTLRTLSTRITNEVRGVTRVAFELTPMTGGSQRPLSPSPAN